MRRGDGDSLVRAVSVRIFCNTLVRSLPLTRAKLISLVRFASAVFISASIAMACPVVALISLNSSQSAVRGFDPSMARWRWMTVRKGDSVAIVRSENWCASVSGKTRIVVAIVMACWHANGMKNVNPIV